MMSMHLYLYWSNLIYMYVHLYKAASRTLDEFMAIADQSGLSEECGHEACSDEEVTAYVYIGFRKYNKCVVGW